jgi:hypothetical protein
VCVCVCVCVCACVCVCLFVCVCVCVCGDGRASCKRRVARTILACSFWSAFPGACKNSVIRSSTLLVNNEIRWASWRCQSRAKTHQEVPFSPMKTECEVNAGTAAGGCNSSSSICSGASRGGAGLLPALLKTLRMPPLKTSEAERGMRKEKVDGWPSCTLRTLPLLTLPCSPCL